MELDFGNFVMPAFWPDWDTHTMVQHDFQGQPLFHHRTQDKLRIDAKNQVGANLSSEKEQFALLKELKKKWPGVMWKNHKPTSAEQVWIEVLTNQKFKYKLIDHGERTLELKADGVIGLGAAELEQRWSLFVIDNVPLLCICSARGMTCRLKRDADRIWRGKWERFEMHQVELIPEDK